MLLKEFILDQFVSPRASRILKEYFPKSWLISTPTPNGRRDTITWMPVWISLAHSLSLKQAQCETSRRLIFFA